MHHQHCATVELPLVVSGPVLESCKVPQPVSSAGCFFCVERIVGKLYCVAQKFIADSVLDLHLL
jgi:hypothetical protein